ncbi:hypothetical protein [Nocardioides sp. GY 10127]|uniref:hypothetical protein n=1 Tax=Nocardioides sp. GY 10127 TaxID=2569762 RepID=UPI0010A86245|nr:hypothetical protein [Nocardioides sp. GY 10127]TIC84162.1 hypothetical protein E8D37_05000 [Nocardioides sp. GY 10127]
MTPAPRRAPSRHVTLRDETPLAGPRIDVNVRLGWLTRMARLLHGAPQLRRMAATLGVGTSTLHRLEIGELRDAGLLRGYEELFALQPGALRGAIGATARTFPQDVVADRRPDLGPGDVRRVSALTEQLLAGLEQPRRTPLAPAGLWLDWASALGRPEAVGLPETMALELLDRLAAELGRSVGPGYTTRYEALSRMRSGPYGHLVVEVARHRVDHPGIQALADLMSAVGELEDEAATAFSAHLLLDRRDRVSQAGVLALFNLAAIGDAERVWEAALPQLLEAYADVEPGTPRHDWLSHALRSLPGRLAEKARPFVRKRLAPAPLIDFEPGEALRAERERECRRAALSVTDALDLEEQPVLARLLYDMGTAVQDDRAVTSYMLLGAHPELSALTDAALFEQARGEQEPALARRAARQLVGARHGAPVPGLDVWLTSPDPHLAGFGVRLRALAGEAVPTEGWAAPDRLDALDPALAGHLVNAWGMAEQIAPLETVRAGGGPHASAADWWLAEGGRLDDAAPSSSPSPWPGSVEAASWNTTATLRTGP